MTEIVPPQANSNDMPQEIPREMEAVYRQEVNWLLQEMKIFSNVTKSEGKIVGDTLLREAWTASQQDSTCDVLEWMIDELRGILSLQGDTLLTNPHYAMQAIQDLLDRCYEKLGGAQAQSAADVQREIASKRKDGYYRSQAELTLLSREIESLIGGMVEKPDVEELARQLEMEDLTRKMAAIAPEVKRERERLGKVETISVTENVAELLGRLSSSFLH